MSGTIRVGDYVRHGEDKGQIVGGKTGAWKFQPVDPAKEAVTLEDKAITAEGFGATSSNDMGGTVGELAGNALVYGIIQKIRSNPTFGHRFMSFVGSDAAYQLFLRRFIDNLVPFMRPASIANSVGVTTADLQDALKAIPVVVIQQIVCKVMYKQGLTSHIFKNLIDAFIAYSGSNLLTRNVSAWMVPKDKPSKFVYRY
jgi:hypothetical protein